MKPSLLVKFCNIFLKKTHTEYVILSHLVMKTIPICSFQSCQKSKGPLLIDNVIVTWQWLSWQFSFFNNPLSKNLIKKFFLTYQCLIVETEDGKDCIFGRFFKKFDLKKATALLWIWQISPTHLGYYNLPPTVRYGRSLKLKLTTNMMYEVTTTSLTKSNRSKSND